MASWACRTRICRGYWRLTAPTSRGGGFDDALLPTRPHPSRPFAEPSRRVEGSEPGQLRAWPGPARWRWQVGSARTTFVSPRVQPPPGRTSEPRGKPPPPWHGTSGRHAKPRPPPRAAMSNDMKPPPPWHRQVRPFRRVNRAQGRPRCHIDPPSYQAGAAAVSRALRRVHRPQPQASPTRPHRC